MNLEEAARQIMAHRKGRWIEEFAQLTYTSVECAVRLVYETGWGEVLTRKDQAKAWARLLAHASLLWSPNHYARVLLELDKVLGSALVDEVVRWMSTARTEMDREVRALILLS